MSLVENYIQTMRDDEFENESTASENSDTESLPNVELEVKQSNSIPKQSTEKLELIEFPLISQYERPLGRTLNIPLDYEFKSLKSYQEIMTRLERENFFRTFRTSLQKNIIQKKNGYFDQQDSSMRKEYQIISNYTINKIVFETIGFVLEISVNRRLPRYQLETAEFKSNQLMLFINKETKNIFAGKSVVEKLPSEEEENTRFKRDFNDKEAIQSGQIDGSYQGEEDDEEEEQEDPFEIIEVVQSFKIKMDILPESNEFFLSLNNITDFYYLISPHGYWNALQQSLNCISQFKQLNDIAFPDQTLHGKQGNSSFPKYETLRSDSEVDTFKNMIEFKLSQVKGLDEYQKQAMKHALFNENTVIQGPPGTGKTYLACKIVSLMHEFHQQYIRKPILVLSKKNLSLDQLLSKIQQSIPKAKMLRIGTKITCPEIKPLSICEQNGPTRRGQSSGLKHKEINSILKNFIKKLKLRENQRYIYNEEELKLSKNLQNTLKERLVSLLNTSLNLSDEDNISEDIQEKIFLKWLKGKLQTAQKVKNLLKQTEISLNDEQDQILKQMIEIQLENEDCNMEKDESIIISHVKNFTCFSQFSIGFSQFLLSQQDDIEINSILKIMREYEKKLREINQRVESTYQNDLGEFMQDFDIIGMTFTGYHMHFQALQTVQAEIVVVEEASEIIESEFFPLLTKNLKHLIQIGDHQQLRPLISSSTLQNKYNYKMSYFERLITVNEVELVTLYNQRRMLPQFADFTRLFYGPKYIDDKSTYQREYVKHISNDGMYMLQHSYPDQSMSDSSYTNMYEALFVKNLACLLVKKYKYLQEKISVITMYKSQKILIEQQIRKNFKIKNIEVFTVDQFQGNENDIIILSCVRSNNEFKNGFIVNDHRINVAFSRARRGFFCIGNFEMYRQSSQTWDKIVKLSTKKFSYGGLIPSPQYKILDSQTVSQLSKDQRFNEEELNNCNLCAGESHIGFCPANQSKIQRQAPNLMIAFQQQIEQLGQVNNQYIPSSNQYTQRYTQEYYPASRQQLSSNNQRTQYQPKNVQQQGQYSSSNNNLRKPYEQKEQKSQIYESKGDEPSLQQVTNVKNELVIPTKSTKNLTANKKFQKQYIQSENQQVNINQWDAIGQENLRILEHNNKVDFLHQNFEIKEKMSQKERKKLYQQQQQINKKK